MDKINVCVACDDNYSKHAGVLIASILTNSNPDDNLAFYILDGGISDIKKEEILTLKKIKDCEINFISVDENNFSEYKKIKTLSHISFVTFYRLKLPSMFPNLKKIIYFDCDMVACHSLKELFETDILNYCIAGCLDIGVKRPFFKDKNSYVNAGMLVFNLEKMRELDIEGKFLKYLQTTTDKLKYADQDIINNTCTGLIYILQDEWNVQSSNFTNRSSYTDKPKIIHFIAKRKPWTYISYSYHRNIYFENLQKTPWKLTEEEYKHWTIDNQRDSLIAYFKYRPLFALRPRFYVALYSTYVKPVLKKLVKI